MLLILSAKWDTEQPQDERSKKCYVMVNYALFLSVYTLYDAMGSWVFKSKVHFLLYYLLRKYCDRESLGFLIKKWFVTKIHSLTATHGWCSKYYKLCRCLWTESVRYSHKEIGCVMADMTPLQDDYFWLSPILLPQVIINRKILFLWRVYIIMSVMKAETGKKTIINKFQNIPEIPEKSVFLDFAKM